MKEELSKLFFNYLDNSIKVKTDNITPKFEI